MAEVTKKKFDVFRMELDRAVSPEEAEQIQRLLCGVLDVVDCKATVSGPMTTIIAVTYHITAGYNVQPKVRNILQAFRRIPV